MTNSTSTTISRSMIVTLSLLGAVLGLVLGTALFDHGPGVEPGVLVTTVLGALTPAGVSRLGGRRGEA